jgi:histone H3/H4
MGAREPRKSKTLKTSILYRLKRIKRGSSMIIKKTEVKEVVGKDFRISIDFYRALDKLVEKQIAEAKRRAKQNRRKTLKPCDV